MTPFVHVRCSPFHESQMIPTGDGIVTWRVDGSTLLSKRAFIQELDRVSGPMHRFGGKLESMIDGVRSLGSPPLSGRSYWLVWHYPDALVRESPTEFYQVYDCLAGSAKELLVGDEQDGELVPSDPALRARLDVLLIYQDPSVLRASLPSLRTLDESWQDTFFSLDVPLDTREDSG